MLVFFDESFRVSVANPEQTLGSLCGIAIPEKQLTTIARDIYALKLKHFDDAFARDGELKGKELLKNWVFRLEEKGARSKNLAFVNDVLNYIYHKNLRVFGCVCFESALHKFKCEDVRALDKTFKFLFSRLDIYMKIEHPHEMASVVFDDRDYGTNKQNALAITNFFLRSPQGLAMDSVVDTPFFAISQAQNIGLQLADLVTSIIAMRFASEERITPYYKLLKRSIYRWKGDKGIWRSGLKVLRADPS
jgi:hypothetical protein